MMRLHGGNYTLLMRGGHTNRLTEVAAPPQIGILLSTPSPSLVMMNLKQLLCVQVLQVSHQSALRIQLAWDHSASTSTPL